MKKPSPAITRYAVACGRLASPVRIAVISDLHNSPYGVKQSGLIEAVRIAAPDLVAFTGDTFHMSPQEAHTLDALFALARLYPSYFIMGNHERHTGALHKIAQKVRSAGATLLSGDCVTLCIQNQAIQLCGLADFSRRDPAATESQLDAISVQLDAATPSILLAHRPERYASYLSRGFDVILSGHTHGGQCRVPFARSGLYAPGQGWFPKYAGGVYEFGSQALVVSRGLAKRPRWAPRIGNPPELVLVDLGGPARSTPV